jgi:uncharacterized lipoprotein YajG
MKKKTLLIAGICFLLAGCGDTALTDTNMPATEIVVNETTEMVVDMVLGVLH